MKTIRIFALLVLTLMFCSCNRNYSELIVGTWQVDKSVSYYVRNDKRIYLDEIRKNDGKIILIAFYEDGQCKTSDGDVGRYHIDGNHVYIDGECARILKLNNKKMILENDDFHAEFDVYYYKSKAEDNQDNHKYPITGYIVFFIGIIAFGYYLMKAL